MIKNILSEFRLNLLEAHLFYFAATRRKAIRKRVLTYRFSANPIAVSHTCNSAAPDESVSLSSLRESFLCLCLRYKRAQGAGGVSLASTFQELALECEMQAYL